MSEFVLKSSNCFVKSYGLRECNVICFSLSFSLTHFSQIVIDLNNNEKEIYIFFLKGFCLQTNYKFNTKTQIIIFFLIE